jgi:hypothetical protein
MNVCDVRSMTVAEIESGHFSEVQIRLKSKRSEKTKKSERKKWDVGTLNKKDVKEEFIKDVTTKVQNTQKKWKI